MSELAMNATLAILQRQALQKKTGLWQNDMRRGVSYLLASLLLSALSILCAKGARAEAPPSQEFWNYLLEYGDAQGEVFDPTDYASVANLPDKARDEFKRAQTNSTSAEMPASALREAPAASSSTKSAQEQPQ